MQFLEIPPEIQLLVAETLGVGDVLSLILVNRHLNALVTPVLHKFAFETVQGFPALHWAAAYGYLPLARLLLDSKRPEIFQDDPRFGCTPLHWAAECDRKEIATLLLEKGVRVDPKDERGLTPLFGAAKDGNIGMMKVLLEHGANVFVRNGDDETMLHIAAKNGMEAVIPLLLEQGIDIDVRAAHRGTALHYAVRHGKESVVRLLIERGANIYAKNGVGDTPVICAAALDHQAIMRLLIEKEHSIGSTDELGDTALHRAARYWAFARERSARLIKPLLEIGADINAQNHAGETPLICAVRTSNIHVTKVLLFHGADVALKTTDGMTAFSCVIEHNTNNPLIMLLLDALLKAPIERWIDMDGPRALLSAAHLQQDETIHLLLERGVDVNVRNSNGETPLHRASAEGKHHQCSVSALLLQRGAAIDARDKDGSTPLHHAAKNAREAVVRLLLKEGADVGAQNNNGETALHLVAGNSTQHENLLKSAEVLLEYGADVNAVNIANQSPLAWALGFGRDEQVIALLRAVSGRLRAARLRELAGKLEGLKV